MSTAPHVGVATSAQIARLLGTTSRQVHAWCDRRATSGFPEPVGRSERPRGGGPRGGPLHDVDAVLDWWAAYRTEGSQSARAVLARTRRREAARLRESGASLREIGTRLGITPQGVRKLLQD